MSSYKPRSVETLIPSYRDGLAEQLAQGEIDEREADARLHAYIEQVYGPCLDAPPPGAFCVCLSIKSLIN